MKLEYTVKNNKYINVKHILKEKFKMSDRLILKLKKNKKIYLNGTNTYINHPVNLNDTLVVYIDFIEDNSNIVPMKMDLNIIYEDDAMLIINKPSGIAIHPSILHYNNSISNGIKYYFDSIGLKKKIRPVNRLDKDTSGLVIFAKNEYIQECLIKQMKSDDFKKYYMAVVDGIFSEKSGTIEAPIARKKDSIIERCVNENGDIAITNYKVIKEINKIMSCIDILLKTGRTHQIRVHMAYINHPIIGDTLYGTQSDIINRQALHAYKICFIHPITQKEIIIEAPIPIDILKIISR